MDKKQEVNSHSGTQPTQNVVLLMDLVSRVQNRTPGLPGIGAFYGPHGWGKTQAVCLCAITHNVYYVQMQTCWTRKYLLEMILLQMGIRLDDLGRGKRTVPHMLGEIGRQLSLSRRPLVVDDAQLALEKGLAGTLCDIYEISQGTVIAVGEEMLPQQFEREGRVHSRILDWVACQPVSLEDARMFAGVYCTGISVSDCLLGKVLEAAHGSARYACNSLAGIAEFARLHSLKEIDAKAYSGRLFTGKSPERRRL